MKLSHFYKIKFLFYLLILVFFNNSLLAKSNHEETLKEITMKLRCMTCQNQNIYESETDFSVNIKKIIKIQIQEGKTEKEIVDFIIDRYGEYIIFKPLFNAKNLFLWVFPFSLFLVSLIFLGLRLKKNKN